MARIAFIGLDKMWLGMARRLLVAAPGADGVLAAMAPRAAGDFGSYRGAPAGISAGARRGVLAIECSTLSHEWVSELSTAARGRGLRYIDAPVTGLPDNATAGELTLLVGAEAARSFRQLCDSGQADEHESKVIDVARHERAGAG